MEGSEKKFTKRQQQEVVSLMPLKTMFPDELVRALADAAGKGKIKKVEELVANGLDVNARGKSNTTSLFWALRKNNIAGFTKLLELGADPNILFGNSSVMHWAAQHENITFLQAAIKHGGNPDLAGRKFSETPLFKTIGFVGDDRKEAMHLLLSTGANINAKTVDNSSHMPIGGDTPVMLAASLGRFDIVYELLESGADYSIKNDNGYDLVDRVSRKKNTFIPNSPTEKDLNKVISWLFQHGVNITE